GRSGASRGSPGGRCRPAFCERVSLWRPKWDADGLHALAAEDVVEGAGELAVAVVDQEAHRRHSLGERPGKLPRLLDGPGTVGVRGAASEVNAAGAKLEEEEHVEPTEPERFDGEEVAGDDRGGMRPQELAPAELDARIGGWHA